MQNTSAGGTRSTLRTRRRTLPRPVIKWCLSVAALRCRRARGFKRSAWRSTAQLRWKSLSQLLSLMPEAYQLGAGTRLEAQAF